MATDRRSNRSQHPEAQQHEHWVLASHPPKQHGHYQVATRVGGERWQDYCFWDGISFHAPNVTHWRLPFAMPLDD